MMEITRLLSEPICKSQMSEQKIAIDRSVCYDFYRIMAFPSGQVLILKG
jgi:hypothetical protein